MLNSRRIDLLHWLVQEKYSKLVANCKARNVSFVCVGSVRDQEYQSYIYEQGRSRKGKIVTNAKYTTFHRDDIGLAFDLCPLVNGKLNWDAKREYKIIQEEARKLGLSCGIDWVSFPEDAHFQLDGGLSSKDILEGKRPSWFYDKPKSNQSPYDKLKEVKIIGESFDWQSACENNQQIKGEYVKALFTNLYKHKTKKWQFSNTDVLEYFVMNNIITDRNLWKDIITNNKFAEGKNVKIVIDRISKLI